LGYKEETAYTIKCTDKAMKNIDKCKVHLDLTTRSEAFDFIFSDMTKGAKLLTEIAQANKRLKNL